jgi:hypothetical protein
MRYIIPYVLVIILYNLGTAEKVQAQTFSCAPDTGVDATNLREYVVRLTGGDPSLDAIRQRYSLPVASASQVQVVTQAKTCKTAAQAYHTAVRGSSVPQISRSVVVVKVTNSRYVVFDPAERQGEFEVTVIFDNAFQPLKSFNS